MVIDVEILTKFMGKSIVKLSAVVSYDDPR